MLTSLLLLRLFTCCLPIASEGKASAAGLEKNGIIEPGWALPLSSTALFWFKPHIISHLCLSNFLFMSTGCSMKKQAGRGGRSVYVIFIILLIAIFWILLQSKMTCMNVILRLICSMTTVTIYCISRLYDFHVQAIVATLMSYSWENTSVLGCLRHMHQIIILTFKVHAAFSFVQI